MPPRTLFEKIWEDHLVYEEKGRPSLIWIDRHLVHEVTSPQAFEGLRSAGRRTRRPDLTFATVDHNVPTTDRSIPIQDPVSKKQIEALAQNCADFGITFFGLASPNQGIVHVIGPELGITLPGLTIVCGDSHTSTHGAFGPWQVVQARFPLTQVGRVYLLRNCFYCIPPFCTSSLFTRNRFGNVITDYS